MATQRTIEVNGIKVILEGDKFKIAGMTNWIWCGTPQLDETIIQLVKSIYYHIFSDAVSAAKSTMQRRALQDIDILYQNIHPVSSVVKRNGI